MDKDNGNTIGKRLELNAEDILRFLAAKHPRNGTVTFQEDLSIHIARGKF